MELAKLEALPKTPMWIQYASVKKDALDALLFYRMGDFYELFLEDAVEASAILGITLTARNRNEEFPVPMCGVPHHHVSNHINKLLSAGKRVAICEQMEEAAQTKGIVRREITRIVSPGMVFDPDSLDSSSNNFCVVIQLNFEKMSEADRHHPGLFTGSFCALDVSTGESFYSDFHSIDELRDELAILRPREIIAPQSQIGTRAWSDLSELAGSEYFLCVTSAPDFYFSPSGAYESLCNHFGVLNLEGFGLSKNSFTIGAVGAAFRKIRDTQKLGDLRHLQVPTPRLKKDRLQLDESTIEHLDIFPKPSQAPQDSLFFHIDRTATAMGARRLKEILARPLSNREEIISRQDAITALLDNYALLQRIRDALTGMRDIERLISKIGLHTANPRDLLALKDVFARLPQLKESLSTLASSPFLKRAAQNINSFTDLHRYLDLRLKEECPAVTREGNIFKTGFSPELDELISLTDDGKSFITNLELKEREATGINSLKVKYNKIFGYYIEVTTANLSNVPSHYIRKQTMAGGERYITEELKNFEDKILRAEDRRIALEEALFDEALEVLGKESSLILKTARELSMLDTLASLAIAARENNYIKPEILENLNLEIHEGRHPALENIVGRDKFIANDTHFDAKNRLFLITGPNMAGKSTYMRQVALITLLAHTGSYVPAKSARIGICDRIATRVGASDRIGRGQSTFMVEMNEMARILRQSTEKSLLIIDEIGRGTSTFDGMALAWAIVEDLHSRLGCRTLFATHYHELTSLENQLSHVKNLSVAIEEKDGDILFLHKVIAGKANGSYGIEVAQLAGLPENIIHQAREILSGLEKKNEKKQFTRSQQLNFFNSPAAAAPTIPPVAEIPPHLKNMENQINNIDIDQCTPVNALLLLKKIKESLKTTH